MPPPPGRPPRLISLILLLAWFSGASFASEQVRPFDIPAGEAANTLPRFAVQSGVEILFSTEAARGVRTNAVKGEFTVVNAVRRMLSGTPLYLVSDTKNGVLRVARAPDPNAPRAPRRATRDRPEKILRPLSIPTP